MKQPPSVVREWPEEDILGLVADMSLEAEEMKKVRPADPGPPVGPRRKGTGETRTVIYRVGKPPSKTPSPHRAMHGAPSR